MKELNNYLNYLTHNQKRSELTIKSYDANINKFLKSKNITTLEELINIKTSDCVEFMTKMSESGSASETVNQVKRCMKAFINYLIDMELVDKNPWNKAKDIPKVKNNINKFLSKEEVIGMINACERLDDIAIFKTYLYTGIRNSALRNIKLEDYDGTHITVTEKRNKVETIILIPAVKSDFDKYLEYRLERWGKDIPWLFVSQKGTQYSSEGIRNKIKSIAKRAGIDEKRVDEIHPHSLRHTMGHRGLANKENIKMVSQMLGHSNTKITADIYSGVDQEILDEAFLRQTVY